MVDNVPTRHRQTAECCPAAATHSYQGPLSVTLLHSCLGPCCCDAFCSMLQHSAMVPAASNPTHHAAAIANFQTAPRACLRKTLRAHASIKCPNNHTKNKEQPTTCIALPTQHSLPHKTNNTAKCCHTPCNLHVLCRHLLCARSAPLHFTCTAHIQAEAAGA